MGGNVNFAKTSFISLKIKVDEDGKFLYLPILCIYKRICQHKNLLRLFKNYDVEYKRIH